MQGDVNGRCTYRGHGPFSRFLQAALFQEYKSSSVNEWGGQASTGPLHRILYTQ